MNDTQALSTIVTSTSLDLAVLAWLDAKFHKSTSEKTRKAYTDTMALFRTGLHRQGLDLDSDPGQVALVAQVFASYSARGKQVKPTTYNHRLAVLSSFYAYAKRQGPTSPLYIAENPIDPLERAKVQEFASPQWRHVSIHNGKARLTFEHTKGGEVMQDDLPTSVTNALLRWLHKWYGAEIGALANDAPLWVSLAHDASYGQSLGYQSLNALCKKHLGTSKVHATRHTCAHSMEKLGASVSEIQARLGHKSLATTGRYLASLKRAENRKADELAALYGIE